MRVSEIRVNQGRGVNDFLRNPHFSGMYSLLYKATANAKAKVYFEQYSSLQTSVHSGRLQLLGAPSRIRPKRCQEPLPRPSNKG